MFRTFLQAFDHLCALSRSIDNTSFRWSSVLEYKQFIVSAFQQNSGQWRARIWRVDGGPIAFAGRKKLRFFETGVDANTAPGAVLLAMAAIDAGTFSANRMHRERYWRCLDKASKIDFDGEAATRRRRSERQK